MLWIISSLVFILLRIAPGDPVDAILGTRANEFARESLRIKLGLDKPLINQYLEYLNNLMHGNLGISINTQEPVKSIISKALILGAPETVPAGKPDNNVSNLLNLLLNLPITFETMCIT